jgi:histone-lysine N-methyltransferase SETMAR
MLLHNALPHAAATTQAMLQEFGWEVSEHPAYSPNLAPSDFHLFPKLKEFLGGRSFKSDETVKDAVKAWLNGLAAEVYDEGIQKLVTRSDMCLNVGGDYVENNLGSVIMIHYFYFSIFLYSQTVFTFWTTLVQTVAV